MLNQSRLSWKTFNSCEKKWAFYYSTNACGLTRYIIHGDDKLFQNFLFFVTNNGLLLHSKLCKHQKYFRINISFAKQLFILFTKNWHETTVCESLQGWSAFVFSKPISRHISWQTLSPVINIWLFSWPNEIRSFSSQSTQSIGDIITGMTYYLCHLILLLLHLACRKILISASSWLQGTSPSMLNWILHRTSSILVTEQY